MSESQRLEPNAILTGRSGRTYRVYRLLSEGGMGSVWFAKPVHPQAGDPPSVAIKSLRRGAQAADAADTQEPTSMRQRFAREMDVMRSIQHPHVMQLLDDGVDATGSPFFVMPYKDGVTSLARALEEVEKTAQRFMVANKRPLHSFFPEKDLLQYLQQIVSGLSTIHAAKVTHRDLKPENVLLVPVPGKLDEREVCLVDCGIAAIGEGSRISKHVSTVSGVMMGTPGFIAPEVCWTVPDANQNRVMPGAYTDWFAFGVLIWRCLTGALPFAAGDLSAYVGALVAHKEAEQLAPEYLKLQIETLVQEPNLHLVKLAQRCLVFEPSKRADYAEIKTLLQQAEKWEEEHSIQPPALSLIAGAAREVPLRASRIADAPPKEYRDARVMPTREQEAQTLAAASTGMHSSDGAAQQAPPAKTPAQHRWKVVPATVALFSVVLGVVIFSFLRINRSTYPPGAQDSSPEVAVASSVAQITTTTRATEPSVSARVHVPSNKLEPEPGPTLEAETRQYERGVKAFKEKRYRDAVKELRSIGGIHLKYPPVFLMLAESAWRLKKVKEACEFYEWYVGIRDPYSKEQGLEFSPEATTFFATCPTSKK